MKNGSAIQSVRAWLVHLPLTKPYTIAYKTIADTEIVFLEIRLENGLRGLGAANPFPEVVGETPAETLKSLQSEAVQNLVGRDIRHIFRLIDEIAAQFPKRPGAQAAVDIALHDLFGQFLGIPVVDFYGRKIESLPTSITIGIKDTAEMLEEAAGYKALGFKVLKIKTGQNAAQDIERVARLREACGRDMALRVDANQGYTVSDLQRFAEATEKYAVELIEQPLPAGEETSLLDLPLSLRRRLCADETLHDAAAALQLATQPQPYGIFNIKLMKCGGIRAAGAIATIAEQAGIDLFWGCNDESAVSIAAALHMAFACPRTRYLDLDGSFDLARDLVSGAFVLENGCMHPSDRPGLGLSSD